MSADIDFLLGSNIPMFIKDFGGSCDKGRTAGGKNTGQDQSLYKRGVVFGGEIFTELVERFLYVLENSHGFYSDKKANSKLICETKIDEFIQIWAKTHICKLVNLSSVLGRGRKFTSSLFEPFFWAVVSRVLSGCALWSRYPGTNIIPWIDAGFRKDELLECRELYSLSHFSL